VKTRIVVCSEYADCPEESEDDSPDEQRMELTPPSDDEKTVIGAGGRSGGERG